MPPTCSSATSPEPGDAREPIAEADHIIDAS
jgi:hypothetical protein